MFISQDLKSFLQLFFREETVFIPLQLYSHITDRKLLFQRSQSAERAAPGLEGVHEEERGQHIQYCGRFRPVCQASRRDVRRRAGLRGVHCLCATIRRHVKYPMSVDPFWEASVASMVPAAFP